VVTATVDQRPAVRARSSPLRQLLSRDDIVMRAALVGLALLLLLVAILPIWALLSKAFQAKNGSFVGLDNFVRFISTPSLAASVGHSLFVATVSTAICITLAFLYAYGLTRTRMPGRRIFLLIAQIPLLAPSLLPAISLVYLFGNQGLAKGLLMGHSVYGPIGIIMGEVFWTLPHALIIITTALGLADARLYEAAVSLKAGQRRIFLTVTLPGARYGLISAVLVVFVLVITDFGVPKVIGGQYNVLATDIYKQVIGQQNFGMGAVVGVILLVPAVLAFCVDRLIQRRQTALLSARAVAYEPKPEPLVDMIALVLCALIAAMILVVIGVALFASLATYWPYNLTPSLKNYDFNNMDGGGWASYYNSVMMAGLTALFGTAVIFTGVSARENPWVLAAESTHPVRGTPALGRAGPRAGPGVHLLFQQPGQSVPVSLRDDGDSRAVYDRPLLSGRAPDRDNRTQTDRPGVRNGICIPACAALPHFPFRHPAGLPAGRARDRDVLVRERDDDGLGRGLPLRAPYHACSYRRPEHG
jgi:iron(III) transport system permease protein